MKTADQNRIKMLTTVQNVLTKHQDTWKDHEAFTEGVEALAETFTAIDEQTQLAQGNPGVSTAKELARKSLGVAVDEVIGAVGAYATVNADPELAAKVGYSSSDVIAGKAGDVVARCKTIHASATENLAALGKYGITVAKLTALKKKIDAFDSIKVAPRENLVTKSAAAQLLPQLVRSAVAIVRDQLDGLVLQFREANPTFFEEYFAARVVVDARGGRTEPTDDKDSPFNNPTPTPSPTPVPA